MNYNDNALNACQKQVDDIIPNRVRVSISEDPDTGVNYLIGEYAYKSVFNGQVHTNSTAVTEAITGPLDRALDLMCGHFSANRVAYMQATDKELLAYHEKEGFRAHPDRYTVA
jgi:hypothetical protein